MTRPLPAEAGFTLIELLVAMIVFAIGMALALPAISNIGSISKRSAADHRAQSESRAAMTKMQTEMREMHAPLRRTQGWELFDDLGRNDGWYHDIFTLGPYHVSFWSDAVSDVAAAGTTDAQVRSEFVSYFLLANANAKLKLPYAGPPAELPWGTRDPRPTLESYCPQQDWCLVREVRRANGSPLVTEIVLQGRETYPAKRLFTFWYERPDDPLMDYLWAERSPESCLPKSQEVPSRGPSPYWLTNTQFYNSPSHWPAVDRIRTYHNAPVAGVTHDDVGNPKSTHIYSVDRVTGAQVRTPAQGQYRGEAQNASKETQIEFRNRLTTEYRRAISCGAQ